MKKLALLSTIAAALTMVACNKASKDAEALSKLGDLQGNHEAAASTKAIGALGLSDVGSSQESFKLTGASLQHSVTYFKTTDGKTPLYKTVEKGEASPVDIGGASQQSGDPKGKYIKIEYKELDVVPLSDEGLKYVNSKQICGVKNIGKVNDSAKVAKADQSKCIGDEVATRYNAYSTSKSKDGKKSLITLASAKGYAKATDVPTSGSSLTDSIELSK